MLKFSAGKSDAWISFARSMTTGFSPWARQKKRACCRDITEERKFLLLKNNHLLKTIVKCHWLYYTALERSCLCCVDGVASRAGVFDSLKTPTSCLAILPENLKSSIFPSRLITSREPPWIKINIFKSHWGFHSWLDGEFYCKYPVGCFVAFKSGWMRNTRPRRRN